MKLRSFDPTDGDLLTVAFFLDAVKGGAIIDHDGYGQLATANMVSDVEIRPSEALGYDYPAWATHVMWYNR